MTVTRVWREIGFGLRNKARFVVSAGISVGASSGKTDANRL